SGPVRHELHVVDLDLVRAVRPGGGREAEVVDLLRAPARGGRRGPDGREAVERELDERPFRSRSERAHEVRDGGSRTGAEARLEGPLAPSVEAQAVEGADIDGPSSAVQRCP